MQISYNAINSMYKYALGVIVKEQILTPDVLRLLNKAQNASVQEKITLRAKLYRKMWKLYEHDLLPYNINQFQFHLNDGESFLRVHEPSVQGENEYDFRKTIREANEDKKYSFGFEGGYISPGFRNVFPISYRGKHIGSVELSLSFDAIKKEMRKLNNHIELEFIMKKSITLDLVGKKYLSKFSPVFYAKHFVIQNKDIANALNEEGVYKQVIANYLKNHENAQTQIAKNIETNKSFSLCFKINSRYYSMHFLPIYNTDDKLSAYIIGYDVHQEIKELYSNKNIILILGILTLFIISLFLFLLSLTRTSAIKDKNKIQTIADTINSGLIVLDKEGRLSFINTQASNMLGYDKKELLGHIIHDRIHYHPTPSVECNILKVGENGISYMGEEEFIKKDGTMFPVFINSAPLNSDDDLEGSVTIFRDITQEKENSEKVKKMAYYDSLTDLPNRKMFFDKLSQNSLKNENSELYSGIIYIDLDDFKNINDTYGHQIGDELLVKVATRISSLIRDEDIMARLGGDEFAIIIEDMSENFAEAKDIFNIIIKKVFDNFERPFSLSIDNYVCTASLGGVVFKSKDYEADDILEKADTAMYEVKKSNKNSYKIKYFS